MKKPWRIAKGPPFFCSNSCSARARKPARRPIAERFWSKVQRSDGCWLWTGTKNPRNPYGHFRLTERRSVRAHRMAWLLTYGPIPKGLSVLHRCDVPLCVRPDHLFLGTHAVNAADRDAKGRGRAPKGMAQGGAVLTDNDVRAIRVAVGRQREIAERFGTDQGTVSRIRSRKAWSHVV